MGHSFTKIAIHAVWSTKDRKPLIKPIAQSIIFEFIKKELTELSCPVLLINGMQDHVHCLFYLNPQKSISEIIKQIKGSTSHYINQQDILVDKFSWQTGYSAFSVDENSIQTIYDYVSHQKFHHQKKSFQQELEELFRQHNISLLSS